MYKVIAGRVIEKNGKSLFSISREVNTATGEAEFTPTQADALAHYVCKVLNEGGENWVNFYREYMAK